MIIQEKYLKRLEQRIIRYPDKECTGWSASINGNGYPYLHCAGKTWGVSRLIWTYLYGPISDGHFVCHHCDNRTCLRISHLFVGTQSENMQDASKKGRLGLTPEQNKDIINLFPTWTAKLLAKKYKCTVNAIYIVWRRRNRYV